MQHAGYDARVLIDELSLTAAKLRKLTACLDRPAVSSTNIAGSPGEGHR